MIDHVVFLLPDYCSGKSGIEEQKQIQDHLLVCPACMSEFLELQKTIGILAQHSFTVPKQSYFQTIVPGLQERLELERTSHRRQWMQGVQRALPISAVAVAAIILLQWPAATGPAGNHTDLRNVVSTLQGDEIAELAVEQDKIAMTAAQTHEFTSAIVDVNLNDNHIIKEALSGDNGAEILSDAEIQKTVQEMDTEQVDKVLARLEERKDL